MIVPDRGKGVKTFRIPSLFMRGLLLLCVLIIFVLGILAYDYFEILRQVHKNKHLTLENRQIREQIEIFEKKINTIISDLDRVLVFEKKLRIITGLEKYPSKNSPETPDTADRSSSDLKNSSSFLAPTRDKTLIKERTRYKRLKKLYEEKIAEVFGLQTSYALTKDWSQLTQQSFWMADKYAYMDYQIESLQDSIARMEINVHKLDQFLLDKESFLRSTPTLLPTKGWITSYFGPRKSQFSGRIKMHEGIDIGARPGSQIISPADGLVTFAGKKPGFGYFVQVDHGYGIETIYAHASKLEVLVGDITKRGMILARVGSTGLSTGPHVHYEVRVNGTPVDPMYYILD
jgi:murein DD-endopeptidase MepM/ murein hydrolase activator NlpD